MAKKKPINKTATADVTVDLQHWSGTVPSYDQYLYGYPLMDLFPNVPMGHGIKLRLTVEMLDEGVPCPVKSSQDKEQCTKPTEKRKANKVIRRTT